MSFKTILVAGASRGIGLAAAEHFINQCDRLLAVSRTAAPVGEWVQADLSDLAGIKTVVTAIGNDSLDALLYMGGTWETHAFTPQYRFAACSDEDIVRVIAVNLVAPIRLVKALLPALQRSDTPRIIFMGALSGRDNFPGREVANSASKFGLRGVVHSLREELRSQRIGVTVINPGNIGTPEVLADLAAENLTDDEAIPLSDLLRILDCVLALSRSTCIKEIDVPAMRGKGA
ncbi:MAG: SDR family NAD(P)-dependent oxidoreductase [Leptolyngbya sp. SIO4C1]|nr:SDR family NAD(P)-dependent oxidoreductase [Leptolyngbya sp. SIO4C1]